MKNLNPGIQLICALGLLAAAQWLSTSACFAQQLSEVPAAPAIVDQKTVESSDGRLTRGKFRVWENRQSKIGRQIHLDFIVLHAQNEQPSPDPLFFIVGGPGQAATAVAARFEQHWIRKDRDIVLINQRGTGGDNRLEFDYTGSVESLQQYFDPIMEPSVVLRNLARLSKRADLRMYSTPTAADDLNDFRKAMRYEKINLMGGSYGTRMCLVYIRQHGATVRTATLSGCAPIEFRNPLYHAEGAQRALEMMFREANSTAAYREAFGDLQKKFKTILERLEKNPATVTITNRLTDKPETVVMNQADFVAAVRLQMYYTAGSRQLPKLLCDAFEGDFKPFVVSSLRQNVGLRQSLALGMLLSVTSAEDLARIEPSEIAELTQDTVFGDARVRSQKAAATMWPQSELPKDFGEPVRSDVETLILSGSIDPVTPPKWGATIHNNFRNSLHVVVPTAHDIGGPCVDQIQKQFLESGKVSGLKIECIQGMQLPSLQLPNG